MGNALKILIPLLVVAEGYYKHRMKQYQQLRTRYWQVLDAYYGSEDMVEREQLAEELNGLIKEYQGMEKSIHLGVLKRIFK